MNSVLHVIDTDLREPSGSVSEAPFIAFRYGFIRVCFSCRTWRCGKFFTRFTQLPVLGHFFPEAHFAVAACNPARALEAGIALF